MGRATARGPQERGQDPQATEPLGYSLLGRRAASLPPQATGAGPTRPRYRAAPKGAGPNSPRYSAGAAGLLGYQAA